MSTIRPLATIAILAVLGVFLAQQINKPKQGDLTADAGEMDYYPAAGADQAPAFQPGIATPAIEAPPAVGSMPPLDSAGPSGVPVEGGFPPLPAMPTESGGGLGAIDAASPATNSDPLAGLPPAQPMAAQPQPQPAGGPLAALPNMDEIPMPENVAVADYNGVEQQQPPLGVAPPAPTETLPPYASPPAYGATPEQGPLPGLAPPAGGDPYDAYDPGADDPVEPADASGIAPLSTGGAGSSYSPLGAMPAAQEPSFREVAPTIYLALERGELTRAHTMLSSWYASPKLTPEERAWTDKLLSQLAGTVVYSTEHRLEPPYTVKPGETLETIAQQYSVPWRLLAKINGVADAAAVQPGQTLKVLRGPFSAKVNPDTKELVLMLGGKYAGKFKVELSGAAMADGQWRVEQKPDGMATAPFGAPAPAGKQLVLKDPSGAGTLIIGAAGGSPMERGRVAVASRDLQELHDILSVGSEVVIRR